MVAEVLDCDAARLGSAGAKLLRQDPAASVADSLRLLDRAMGTAEYSEGVNALTEKRRFGFQRGVWSSDQLGRPA